MNRVKSVIKNMTSIRKARKKENKMNGQQNRHKIGLK